jgi:hypothetical protein
VWGVSAAGCEPAAAVAADLSVSISHVQRMLWNGVCAWCVEVKSLVSLTIAWLAPSPCNRVCFLCPGMCPDVIVHSRVLGLCSRG